MKQYFLIVLLGLFLVGCGGDDSIMMPTTTPVATSATVEPTAVLPEPTTATSNGYPAAGEAGYPPPVQPNEVAQDEGYPPPAEPTRATDGVRFSLTTPLLPEQTEVSGTAPPGLSLAIVNITYNGALLGTGTSDADGNFTINVPPLTPSIRVGITLSQLDEYESLDEAVNALYAYRGDSFMNIPNVGIYFETAAVED